MHGEEIGTGEQLALFSRRNYSMSSAGQLLVLGSLALVTLAISLGFAIQGAWLVLPFAGLECGAIYLAFRWLRRHEGDYESVLIEDDSLIVECGIGGKVERFTFSRAWAQVVVESGSRGRARVLLRSHGREVEVGRLLSDEAKRAAAARLRSRLSGKPVNKS